MNTLQQETIDGRAVWMPQTATSDRSTPEVDGEQDRAANIAIYHDCSDRHADPSAYVVSADFARRLERERDEARLSLKHALEAECFDCATLRAENAKMREALELVAREALAATRP